MIEREVKVGLDIGTTKVCTVIGFQNDNSELEIIGVGSHPSQGLKKGAVVNIDQTIVSIQKSLEQAKLMAGVEIDQVSVGVAGNHIYSFNSSGVVAVRGEEVTLEDVHRVVEAAKAVVMPSDREIIHVIPQEFKVDNSKGIKNPIGMFGVRLEVKVHIVTGAVSLIQNLVKCVEESGVIPIKIVLQPIASSESVLSEEEKELGVVLVDIGGGTTDVAIWSNGCLLHSQIIPVGGQHFTNDLSVALKISHIEAERIKTELGCVIPEKTNQSKLIQAQGIVGTKPRDVPLKIVTKVLEARAEELLRTIKEILDEKVSEHEIAGGIIFTGGGSLIKGIVELGEYVLEIPVKIGHPKSLGGMTNIMQSPKYSTAIGLLLESHKLSKANVEKDNSLVKQSDIIARLSNSMKNVLKEIF